MIVGGSMVEWTGDVQGWGIQKITGMVSHVTDTRVWVNCCVAQGINVKVNPQYVSLDKVTVL